MSRQIQIRRGSATDHANFTGAIGEITMDTTNKTLRVHDGETAGGIKLAKQSEIPSEQTLPDNYDFVIESQIPTAENNYTWYRKYKSGWVEQGGVINAGGTSAITVVLPITMQDTLYNIQATCTNSVEYWCGSSTRTTNTCTFRTTNRNGEGYMQNVAWCVSGMMAH